MLTWVIYLPAGVFNCLAYLMDGVNPKEYIKKRTNLMLHALFANIQLRLRSGWRRILSCGVCVCVCVCAKAYSTKIYLGVLFAFRKLQGWQQKQIAFRIRHSRVERLRQRSCIRPVCLFLSLYICDVIWKVRSSHAGVSSRWENIWLYRNRLLRCWHHQEFSISDQQKIPPSAFPLSLGKEQYFPF